MKDSRGWQGADGWVLVLLGMKIAADLDVAPTAAYPAQRQGRNELPAELEHSERGLGRRAAPREAQIRPQDSASLSSSAGPAFSRLHSQALWAGGKASAAQSLSTSRLTEPSRKKVKGLPPGTHSRSLLCFTGSDLITWPSLNHPPWPGTCGPSAWP